MPALSTISHSIIFFDGVCNLCTGSVQFVIRRDPKKHFKFISLQSEAGKQMAADHPLTATLPGTFILLENGKVYTKSTAALRIFKKLNGLWSLLYAFIIVPPFIRNAVYNLIAKNRYQWFGKKEECWVPTNELNDRFFPPPAEASATADEQSEPPTKTDQFH
jgi:predicted DCC family thiol-disulfide oxidoreductase YuxK